MKKTFALLLSMIMLISCIVVQAEELPQYAFSFYGDISFLNYGVADCKWIGKNNGKKAVSKKQGDSYIAIISDLEIAGQQGVRAEFAGDPDEYYLVAQCAYFFNKADESVYTGLLELLTSIYDMPQHTEADSTSYNIADVCYDVCTSGLALSKQDNAKACQRYAQWMAMDMDSARNVLIDLSFMTDKKGNALECAIRYTLLPENTQSAETQAPTSITDGL